MNKDTHRSNGATASRLSTEQESIVAELSDDELDTFRRICKNMKYAGPVGGDEAINGMDLY